jgi:hypothetical protein
LNDDDAGSNLTNRNEESSLFSTSDSVHNLTTASYDHSFDIKDLFMKNPFKIEEKSEYENLEYALQILEDLTARMNISILFLQKLNSKIFYH